MRSSFDAAKSQCVLASIQQQQGPQAQLQQKLLENLVKHQGPLPPPQLQCNEEPSNIATKIKRSKNGQEGSRYKFRAQYKCSKCKQEKIRGQHFCGNTTVKRAGPKIVHKVSSKSDHSSYTLSSQKSHVEDYSSNNSSDNDQTDDKTTYDFTSGSEQNSDKTINNENSDKTDFAMSPSSIVTPHLHPFIEHKA